MSYEITAEVSEFESDDVSTFGRTTCRAVAEAKGVDPLDLPPLAETIDVESLDTFVNRSSDVVAFSLAFEYAGCLVTITETEISVEPNDES